MTDGEKSAVLGELIEELLNHGSWCGETHVQKAAYLAQELLGVPLGFEFVIYKHGPFSFDLRDALTAMRANNLLLLQFRSDSYGPSLLPAKDLISLKARLEELLAGYSERLKFVAGLFEKKGVKELEKLSTAYFVSAKLGLEQPLSDRAILLHELKPHVPLDEAEDALRNVDLVIEKGRAVTAA